MRRLVRTEILILFLVFGLTHLAFSQFEEIVNEKFSGPSKTWWTGKDETKIIQIADGKYKLKLIKTENGRLFHISVDPDFNNDFTIEATFKQLSGDENSGIGFLWGYDPNTGDNNSFCFTTSGYVRSWTSDDKKAAEREWEESAVVKSLGQENKLRLEKTGTHYKFILNNKTVLTRENFTNYGDKIGLVLYADMDVWVDDFIYAEKRTPEPIIEMPPIPDLSILYEETFKDNAEQWLEGKNDSYESRVEDGKYYINFLSLKGGHYFFKSVALNPKKDFIIQAEITQQESTDDAGFGIVWGYENPKKMFGFITCEDGNTKIYHAHEDTTETLLPWKKLKFINANGSHNILSIIQLSDQWYFLINEHVIYKCAAQKLHGFNIGFEVNKRMDIAIDRLTVKQSMDPINLVPNLPIDLVKEIIPAVNSDNDDISPKLSPDGKTLYIVRKKHPGNMGEKDDIWHSNLQPDGSWSEMKNMGEPINNAGHNMVVSVSPDNNALTLMNTYNEDGTQLGAGVSKAYRSKTGWSIPVNQKIDNYYNTSNYAEMCLSTNQKVLLFTIERKDTYGARDLYVSFLKSDGSWTEPKNMGIDVNTLFDEGAPFLAADDKTLYFSSNGWPGYGNKDIFITKRLDDSWTKWAKPQNMGPAINSIHWDSYYTTSASGDFAIVASSHDRSGSDLYSVQLPTSAKPEAVIIVHGKVLNAKTKEPIEAEISYEILSAKEEAGTAHSNPLTGEYKIILNYGNNFGFHAKAKGYFSVNENMELTKAGAYKEIEKDLFLVPLSVGEVIKLNNVFFVQSKPMLKSESFLELDRLAAIMLENPTLIIELAGYTDNQGKKKLNQELSDKRVIAVMNYLLTRGINKSRMSGRGYGGDNPIMPNDTEENRQKNRRVEFKIIKE